MSVLALQVRVEQLPGSQCCSLWRWAGGQVASQDRPGVGAGGEAGARPRSQAAVRTGGSAFFLPVLFLLVVTGPGSPHGRPERAACSTAIAALLCLGWVISCGRRRGLPAERPSLCR